ncbi:MAG: glycosyltransferase family 4 protein [Methanomicrobiales archaeon]|nr:glycosyltransferase family 4 protein [Methanomicrobiales archaeon]
MKILHIYDGHEQVRPGEGSVPSTVYHLVQHTARLGHEVTVLERRWEGTKSKEIVDGIEFDRLNLKISSNVSNSEIVYEQMKKPQLFLKFFFDRLIFALKANRYLKKTNFDVIHVHLPFSANIIVHLSPHLKGKFFYTAHIGEEKKRLNPDRTSPFLLRAFSPDWHLIKRISKTIILNQPLKETLVNKGIPSDKLEVIPLGIDVDEYTADLAAIQKIREKFELHGMVVLFSGTITPRKGVEYLLQAAEYLKKEDILFIIVGNLNLDKEYAQLMITIAKEKNLKVKFVGYIPYDDLKALFLSCDLFVLPSVEEGDPVSLKEALACGKPLIGSDVGGITMQIIDSWNGFLVKPRDAETIAKRIRFLFNQPEERKRMGFNSKLYANEKFNWESIVKKYIKLYMDSIHEISV